MTQKKEEMKVFWNLFTDPGFLDHRPDPFDDLKLTPVISFDLFLDLVEEHPPTGKQVLLLQQLLYFQDLQYISL